ncbi:UNVERIFIED_CONTAM: phosphate transport system substrate-binding protein [Acetivibrio alkalicellulosi]
MKKILFILVSLVILMTSGCQWGNSDKDTFSKETFARIDGSTATIPLSEAIVSELLGLSDQEAMDFVNHNKTHNAYMNLIEDKADIIFVTEPSKHELQIAENANIELEVVPVVKEGFVFLVNSDNPVDSLTSSEVRDIYQGKITNWRDVGGNDLEIIAFQRNPTSGSQTLMEQIVMKDLEMAEPKMMVGAMDELINQVAGYDNSEGAIGYSVYYYASLMYSNDNIKILQIDGINPDNESISKEIYPFTSAYYAVLKKSDPQDAPSRKLLNWLLSEPGQKTAEEARYVPVIIPE